MGIIYKTTNLINGKIYIGQDSNNNENYFGSGKILKRAIKKYGKENFKKEILEIVDDLTILDEREIYWINELNSTDRNIGYNISKGGQSINRLGVKHTDDWKKNMSVKNSGVNNPFYGKHHLETTKQKISESLRNSKSFKDAINNPVRLDEQRNRMLGSKNPFYGVKLSDEHRKKISEANKGKIISDETKEKISKALTGRVLSKNHRRKISNYHRGKIVSEETKEKIRIANLGKTLSKDIKDKISKSLQKVVLEVINGVITRRWASPKEASIGIGETVKAIRYQCRKQNFNNKLNLIYEKDFKE